MFKILKYILLINLFLVALKVTGDPSVIDKVCQDAIRTYRVNLDKSEGSIKYNWILKDPSGNSVSIPSGRTFKGIDSNGYLVIGSEVEFQWSFNPGIYTLTVEKTSSYNCSIVELGAIEVVPKPNVDAGKDQTICDGGVVSLSDAVALNTTPSGIEWTTNGDGKFDDDKTTNPNYIPGTNDVLKGEVTLKLTAKSMDDNDDGCFQENEMQVTIVTTPKLVINDPDEVCEPNAVDLTAAEITNGSIISPLAKFTYWKDAAAIIPMPNANQIITSGTYFIKADVNGYCPDIKPVTVVIRPQPNLVITTPPEVCEPKTVDISLSYITSGSDPGQLSYWNDISAKSPLINYKAISASGTYYIKITNTTTLCDNIKPVAVVINKRVVPLFNLMDELCLNIVPPVLPDISVDGFKGTWSPSVISTSSLGPKTYTFTPDDDQCALPFKKEINITNEIFPTFDAIGILCQGATPPSLPATSKNGIAGTWNPTSISTATTGTKTYTFTPTSVPCANLVPLSVTVIPVVTPTFVLVDTLCGGSEPPLLSLTSDNGIKGHWSPSIISTAKFGTTTYTFTSDAGQCGLSFTKDIFVTDPILIMATTVPVGTSSMPIGEIHLTVTGGSGNFSYLWNTGATTKDLTGLYPDNYTVTVTDKTTGCIEMKYIPLSMPLVVKVNSLPIKCYGDFATAEAVVSGGILNYKYQWSNGQTSSKVTGLTAGDYWVTVTDNNGSGTTKKESFTVAQPANELVISISKKDVGCFDGSDGEANATVSGGTPPYNISWSNGQSGAIITGITSKAYTVYVNDANGCALSAEVTVNQPPSMTITPTVLIPPICPGENGTVHLEFTNVPDGLHDIYYAGGTFKAVSVAGGKTVPDLLIIAGKYDNLRINVLGCYSPVGVNFEVIDPPAVIITAKKTDPDCKGGFGSIDFSFTNVPDGIYDIEYVGGRFQNVSIVNNYAKIDPVKVGVYNGVKIYANGCWSKPIDITIKDAPEKTLAAVKTDPICVGSKGKIMFSFTYVPDGVYDIDFDGGHFNAVDVIGGRATVEAYAGTYNNLKLSVNGCLTASKVDIQVIDPPAIVLDAVVSQKPNCFLPKGTIEVKSPLGNSYEYSFDAGAYQSMIKYSGLDPESSHTLKVRNKITGCESKEETIVIDPMPSDPVISLLSMSSPNCIIPTGTVEIKSPAGGDYKFMIDGGTPQVSPKFNNLDPGTVHKLRVINIKTGCQSADTTITMDLISAPPVTPLARVTYQPNCKSGFGTITVSDPLGSDFEYSINGTDYKLNPVFSGLLPGSYVVIVRSKSTGCESTGSSLIVTPVPPEPTINLVSWADSKCYGEMGSISLEFKNLKDSTYNINYNGNLKFENVVVTNGKATINALAGKYNNLSVDVNGCNFGNNLNVVINQPNEIKITATITGIDIRLSRKGSIALQVSGGTPGYSYNWEMGDTTKNIQQLSYGTYKVRVTDKINCTKDTTFVIPKPDYPPVAVDDEFIASCSGVKGNIVLNDYDPEDKPFFIDTVSVIAPLHGALTLNLDGSFDYWANIGYAGLDSFQYAIFDAAHYLGDTATVYITVVSDFDCDLIPDDIDPDADGDGILNVDEGDLTADSDGDGHPNWLDIDADNDGIVDNIEGQSTFGYIAPQGIDTDNDGIDDAYDPDNGGVRLAVFDNDGDGIPDFLDTDSDNDLVPDYIEGHDMNADGKPDHIFSGRDSDADGLSNNYDTVDRYTSPYENMTGGNAAIQDFDGDGIKDWRDDNDDDDKYLTRFEDLNADMDYSNDDTDHDGHPEYLDFGRDCDLFIPDAFSPNGDNIHDYFQIYCIDHFPDAKMYIFDQLGNKLFEKEHYGNLEFWGSHELAWWDGRTTNRSATTTSGGKASPGTYYYVLNLGNGEVKKSFVFISY